MKKMRLGIAVSILFVSVVMGSYSVMNAFRIREIEVVGVGVSIAIDTSKLSNNLIFFPSQKITAQLLRDNPLVSHIIIEKKFPHTLVIHVIRRPAIAKLRTDHQYLLVGSDGVVVGDAASEMLPELRFSSDVVSVGERIGDKRILAALMLIKNSPVPLQGISAWDGQSLKARVEKTDIIIAQDDAIATRAATLQTLLVGFRMKGIMPAQIDLRFDKPIVVF